MKKQRLENYIFCVLSFLSSVPLIIWVSSLHTDAPLSAHGFYHSAYVYQILNGIIPPTSMHTIGTPAGTYWCWHLLVAAVVQILGVTPPEAAIVIAAFSLWFSLIAIWLVTAQVTTNFWYRAYFSALPLILFNPFYGLSRMTMSADFLRQPFFGIEYPEHVRGVVVYLKYFEYSAFPFALSLFAVLIALLLSSTGREKRWGIACGILAFIIALVHPVVASAVGILAVSQAMVLLFEAEDKQAIWALVRLRTFSTSPLFPPTACIVAMLFALPVMIPILDQAPSGLRFYLDKTNFIGSLVGFSPLLPFLFAGICCFKLLSQLGRVCLLTSIGLVLARCTLQLIDENQYKYLLLSSYPGTLLLLALARVFYDRLSRRRHSLALLLRRTIEFLGLLTLITLASTVWHRSRYFNNRPTTVAYHGKNVDIDLDSKNLPQVKALQATFRWLRENTPVESYVIVWPQDHNKGYLPTLAQRRVVATSPSFLTEMQPQQTKLVAAIENILSKLPEGTINRGDYDKLFGLDFAWPNSLFLMTPRRGVLEKQNSTALIELFKAWPVSVVISYANQSYLVFHLERQSN